MNIQTIEISDFLKALSGPVYTRAFSFENALLSVWMAKTEAFKRADVIHIT